jgi:hypothetical protein
MTFKEMVYEVWEDLRRQIVDDDEIDERLIKRAITNQRELWLSNLFNKGDVGEGGGGGTSSGTLYGYDYYVQRTSCLNLEDVECDSSSDYCLDDMFLKRTEGTIPRTVNLKSLPAITRIVPCACILRDKIDFNSIDRARNGGNGRFNSKQIFAFLYADKLYFACKDETQLDALTSVVVSGIFADPTEVDTFDEDDQFPIDGKIWEYMRPIIVQRLLNKVRQLEDKTNDSQDQNLQTDG